MTYLSLSTFRALCFITVIVTLQIPACWSSAKTKRLKCYECKSDEDEDCLNIDYSKTPTETCSQESVENFINRMKMQDPHDSIVGRTTVDPLHFQCGTMRTLTGSFISRFCTNGDTSGVVSDNCHPCKYKVDNDAECCTCKLSLCNSVSHNTGIFPKAQTVNILTAVFIVILFVNNTIRQQL